MLGAASNFIDAADVPPSGVDRVILQVLVDPGAEAGRGGLRAISIAVLMRQLVRQLGP